MTRKIMPITHPYLSHMERHPKILETLKCQTFPVRKDPYFEGISIHHSLLYKHQTSFFLMYVETL